MTPKIAAVSVILSLAGVAWAQVQGRVQPDPARPCGDRDFKQHELCFETPKDGIARAEFLSEPFYSVILRTAKPCTITEKERLQAQGLFPRNKVFSMRFNCDGDIEENIRYTNVKDQFGFLAVYAGRTLREANVRLEEVKATGQFPGANIRKMRASLVYP